MLPHVTTCPLCRAKNALQVRSCDGISCVDCGFIGDVVQFVQATRQGTLETALSWLKTEQLIGWTDQETAAYSSEVAEQMKLRRLFEHGGRQLVESDTVVNVLMKEQLHLRPSRMALTRVQRHMAVLRRKDFADFDIDLPKQGNNVLSSWEHLAAVVVPCWSGWRIVGAWLITTPGVMPLKLYESQVPGLAGIHALDSGADEVFIVDNAAVWARVMIRQADDGELRTPVLCSSPLAVKESPGLLGRTVPIFWTTDPGGAIPPEMGRRALMYPGARMVCPWLIPWTARTSWPDTVHTSAKLFIDLARAAKPAAETLSRMMIRLLTILPPKLAESAKKTMDQQAREARGMVAELRLSSDERASLLNHAHGPEVDLLTGLLDQGSNIRSVDFEGKLITETPDGWYVDGQLISDVVLRIQEIVQDPTGAGEMLARGVLVFRRRAHAFEVPLDQLRHHPGEWAHTFLNLQSAGPSYTQSKYAGQRMYAIAVRFCDPRYTTQASRYGWADGTLRLARFSVDRHGVHPQTIQVKGPAIPYPEAMSPGDYQNFQNGSFNRLGLALLGNLLRTARGEAPKAIIIENQPQLVELLAEQLGQPVEHDTDVAEIEARGPVPLPICGNWSEAKLRQLLRSTARNYCCSVDSITFDALRIQPGFCLVQAPRWPAGASIRWIFHALGHLLDLGPCPNDHQFYEWLASQVAGWLPAGTRNEVKAAGGWISTSGVWTNHSKINQVITVLGSAQRAGDLEIDSDEMLVKIKLSGLRQYLARALAPAPPLDQIVKHLIEKQLVVRYDDDAMWISTINMAAYGSYAASNAMQ